MRRVALIVGNDRYDDPEIRPLDYAVADATELGGFLRHKAGYHQVTPLFNADDRAILRAAEELLADLGPEDLFLFFFAGHATTVRSQHLLLCAQSRLAWVHGGHEHGTLPFTLLRDTTAASGANRVFIFDACRGEIRRARDGAAAAFRGEAILRDLVARPAREGQDASLPKLLCSCAEGEHALESPRLRHGLFTMAMLEEFETARQKGSDVRLSQAFLGRLQRRMNQIAVRHQLEGQQRPWLNRFDEDPVVLVPSLADTPGPDWTGRPSRGSRSAPPTGPACPGCGSTEVREMFRCERCGKVNLCAEHRSDPEGSCEWCAAKFEILPATFAPIHAEPDPPAPTVSSDPARREDDRWRDCEAHVRLLGAALAELQSGNHPALRPGLAELQRLEHLARRCQSEIDSRRARLPPELAAALDQEAESNRPPDPRLHDRVAGDSPVHLTELYRRWHEHRRKVGVLLESARATWEGIRGSELGRLVRRHAELQNELLQLQEASFAHFVRAAFLPGFDASVIFPEATWNTLAPRLAERGYPWSQVEARQRAIRLFDGWCRIEKEWQTARRQEEREAALGRFLSAHPQSHRSHDAARDIGEEQEWRAARLAPRREAALREVLARHPLGHRRIEIEADLLEEQRWHAARTDPGDRGTLFRELLLAFPRGHRRAETERDQDEERQWLAARAATDRRAALAEVRRAFPGGHRSDDVTADLDEETRWHSARQTLERENALRELLAADPPVRHRRADLERDLREELEWQAASATGLISELDRFLANWPDGHRSVEATSRAHARHQEESDWLELSGSPPSHAIEAFLERYPESPHAGPARRLLKSARRREAFARLLARLGPAGQPRVLVPLALLLVAGAVAITVRLAPNSTLAALFRRPPPAPAAAPSTRPSTPTDPPTRPQPAPPVPTSVVGSVPPTRPAGGSEPAPVTRPAPAAPEPVAVPGPAPAPATPAPPRWHAVARDRIPELLAAARAGNDPLLARALEAFPADPDRAASEAAAFRSRLETWWGAALVDAETENQLVLTNGLPRHVLPLPARGAAPELDDDLVPRLRAEFERRSAERRAVQRLVEISGSILGLIPEDLLRVWRKAGLGQQLFLLVQTLFRQRNLKAAEQAPNASLALWSETFLGENTNVIGEGLRGRHVYELPPELDQLPDPRRFQEQSRLNAFIQNEGYDGFKKWREEIQATNPRRGRRGQN